MESAKAIAQPDSISVAIEDSDSNRALGAAQVGVALMPDELKKVCQLFRLLDAWETRWRGLNDGD